MVHVAVYEPPARKRLRSGLTTYVSSPLPRGLRLRGGHLRTFLQFTAGRKGRHQTQGYEPLMDRPPAPSSSPTGKACSCIHRITRRKHHYCPNRVPTIPAQPVPIGVPSTS